MGFVMICHDLSWFVYIFQIHDDLCQPSYHLITHTRHWVWTRWLVVRLDVSLELIFPNRVWIVCMASNQCVHCWVLTESSFRSGIRGSFGSFCFSAKVGIVVTVVVLTFTSEASNVRLWSSCLVGTVDCDVVWNGTWLEIPKVTSWVLEVSNISEYWSLL